MSRAIKFSILIPAYKSRFFGKAIESVLSQTYPNWELIVVDDHSPEDLLSIANRFRVDTRIKYYRNDENFGALNVVDNWNKCLSLANGDYVICMGDDDLLSSNCLQSYSEMANKYPDCNVIHGRTSLIDSEGNTISILEARDEHETIWMNIYYRWKQRYQYIGDYCFKADALKKRGGFYKLPLAWGSDDVTVNMMAYGGGIANVNDVLFYYRVSPYTISSSTTARIKFDAVLSEEKLYEDMFSNATQEDAKDNYYLLAHRLFQPTFLKKKIDCISSDISMRYANFFYWVNNRKVTNVGFKMIVYALLNAFIQNNITKYKNSKS